jgi:hypothetical protein
MKPGPAQCLRNSTSARVPPLLLAGILAAALLCCPAALRAVEPSCPGGSQPDPAVIFCDDFESGEPVAQRYFEYDDAGGEFVRVPDEGFGASHAMRAHWRTGAVGAGSLKRAFGRVPQGLGYPSQSHNSRDFREIYWRLYLRNQPGWSGRPDKLSRALVFGSETSWATAMAAHVWSSTSQPILVIDPASGIDGNNNLVTTSYNDFAHLRWLGAQPGAADVFFPANAGTWFCIEAHVKLNAVEAADGVFELWINGSLDAQKTGLNWVGSWQNYGINSIFVENFWNNGAPGERVRFIDNIVISTRRIGCAGEEARPAVPKNFRVTFFGR